MIKSLAKLAGGAVEEGIAPKVADLRTSVKNLVRSTSLSKTVTEKDLYL